MLGSLFLGREQRWSWAAKDPVKSLLALLIQVEGKGGSKAIVLLSSGEYYRVVPNHNVWDVLSPSHVKQSDAGT